MTNIKAKLEQLFEFIKTLEAILEQKEYEQFNEQQAIFGEQLKQFLDSHPENDLIEVIEQLKELQNKVKALQQQADIDTTKLKEKSLSLQRNKNKIKAYK